MCYHKSVPQKEVLSAFLKHRKVSVMEYDGYFHASGYDHPKTPVLTCKEPHIVQPFIWGFVPFYASGLSQAAEFANKTLNAKSETLFTTPMYKAAACNRCLVFVDGFFEWKWEDEKGKQKTPYYIFMPGHEPFALGGVYNLWTDKETGEVFHTYSVVTTGANLLMSEIHNNKKRMPLILPENSWDLWLDRDAQKEKVESIMKPFPEGQLQTHEISRDITKRGVNTNRPEIQEKYVQQKLF